MIRIVPVKSKKELMRFIKLPFALYKNEPNWTPPLISEQKKFFDPKRNPYYEHSEVQLFLAYKNDELAGRISAHTNTQHNRTHNDSVGFFGFFESINDQEVANSLLDTAIAWLTAKKCDAIRGPMNFSVNDECAMLVDGFDSPSCIMLPYNFRYYIDLLENAGLKKVMDMYSYYTKVVPPPERITRLAEKIKKRYNITLRDLSKNKEEMKRDLKTIFTVYTKAWEKNWGFVPMTKKEFDHTVKELMPLAVPEFIYIAEIDGKPAGISITLPDYHFVLRKMKGKILPFGIFKALYYKNKISRLRVAIMGVIDKYKNKGVDVLFYHRSFETAMQYRDKYYDAEFSWVLENNVAMNRIAESIGGKIYKTYRIYEKSIA